MTAAAQLEEQKQRFEKFFKLDPTNTNLLYQLIDIKFQLAEFEQALAFIEEYQNSNSTTALLDYKKSNLLLAMGKPQEALVVLDAIELTDESREAVLINKAHAHFHLGNFAQVKDLLSGLQSQPEASVYILQARSYHHTGELNSAILLLKEADKLYPNDADIKGLLSLLLLDDGDYSQATLDYAEQALQGKPQQMESLLTAGMMQQHYVKDLLKAEHYFDKAVQLYPHVGRGWLYKGLAVMLRKELVEAQPYLSKACELMPEHIGSWHSLAWNHILSKEIEQAQNCFETSLTLDRNFAESHGGLSVIYAIQGQAQLAERTAKIALRLNPQCFSAHYTLMLLENAKNNPEKVQQLVQDVFNTEQGLEAQEFIKVLQGDQTSAPNKEQ